ncbi:MAG: alpha/beta hydrolase [Myxococcales bacterium]|nr:alpha/beta hydrolase [Myxococcales bacterium]
MLLPFAASCPRFPPRIQTVSGTRKLRSTLAALVTGTAWLVSACANTPGPRQTTLPAALSSDHEKTFPLWKGPAPGAEGDALTDVPTLTVYLPRPDRANGAAVVVNPGGGYWVLAADHEGVQAARWLNREGMAAFVLRYRKQPVYDAETSIADGQRALRWVRAHARQYGISPGRIGMMGFSAGGNLASAVATDPEAADPAAADPIDRQSSRPDFLLLVYPAISHAFGESQAYGRSTERFVDETTPPTFTVTTHEDHLSPLHSVRFYERLLAIGVSAELHIFAFGPHGTGVAAGDPDLGVWRTLAIQWMRRSGLFTEGRRQALRGRVFVGGIPLAHGWVTFHPEDPKAPLVAAYISAGKEGHFEVDPKQGPVPGRYRAEVTVLSTTDSDVKTGKTSLRDAVSATRPEGGRGALWLDLPTARGADLTLRLAAP